jgi:chemotaxis protein MotB
MGLLMSFFVVVAAFSSQDKVKMQALMGSMREAFGNTRDVRLGGVVELNGHPIRNQFTATSPIPNTDTEFDSTRDRDMYRSHGDQERTTEGVPGPSRSDQGFAHAAATLRQAWQSLPEVAALSSNIIVEETPDGLAVTLVDQDNRPMFPEGSRFPYERTRMVLQSLAPVLARLPNQVAITGHTASVRLAGRPGYSNWDLSSERANAVRQVLTGSGLSEDRIAAVTGKADSQPLLPSSPNASSNGRVSIVLLRTAPPLPRHIQLERRR